MFGLSSGSGTDHLTQAVEEKKSTVNQKDKELQELEARLRETEERLKKVSRNSSPARQANTGASMVPPIRTPPSGRTLQPSDAGRSSQLPSQTHTYPEDRQYASEQYAAEQQRPQGTRQDTATMMRGMPGAMPETPPVERLYGGREDYVMVNRSGRSTPQYGQSVR